ncbi:unnamed protein product (macronuclear) [Paramecium tetraurelia]|uniref:SET domain-containing protein n=1 Tax=Paramecium tetraurelia TaxID=5888 RepID=A0E843_PARTE|nr:uncharacterized protein GSPATT00024188001 [Paramecium tetraurelia]CAK91460.1 unnamed protein product [Paramecium tetraurelia]|eukprot:XP_001458857.1 hypothetical protein (macronuclear) [Paramecium tetraurelia strain d4-2]
MQQLKNNYIGFLRDGLQMNKVEMEDYGGMFGIKAIDNIKSGEYVIKVSHNYAISAFTVFQNEQCVDIMKKSPHIYPSLQQIGNKKSDFQTLILYLTIQRNGKLKPIFDLSTNPTCLLDCDQPIPFDYLRELKQEFEEEYKAAKDEVMEVGLNSEDYDWAYRYCMNRRLSVNNDYPFSFLVPMVDMINHGKNKAIFGLEQEHYQPEEYIQNNYMKFKYISQNKYWFSQEDQEVIESLNVNESERCSKILNKLLEKLFQELLRTGSSDIWVTKLMMPDDSEDEDEPTTEKSNDQSQQLNTKDSKVQAAVNDDYLRDYYEQTLDQSEHDWYTDIQQQTLKCPAYLTARAVDDIEKGEQVLNLYGCLGNEHLLMYYGFALSKNKYDRVKFRIFMDCSTKYDFLTNIEKLVQLHYVPYKELLNLNTRGISLNQLTSEFKIKKSQFNLDLMKFLRTYLQLLDGEELINEETIIVLYRRIINSLYKKISTPTVPKDSYWGEQIFNYQNSKARILKAHLEMIDNLTTKPEKMGIKVFMRLRAYLLKQN